jgi:hypothetical protein
MRALLCHCRQHLEARDDEALYGVVRDHLMRDHPAIPPTEEQVAEIVTTRAYNLEYVLVYATDSAFEEEEEFGPDPN